MRTCQELLKAPEFAPLLASTAAHMVALTVSGLALGTLMYDATGSPLLAALSMFGPKLAQILRFSGWCRGYEAGGGEAAVDQLGPELDSA